MDYNREETLNRLAYLNGRQAGITQAIIHANSQIEAATEKLSKDAEDLYTKTYGQALSTQLARLQIELVDIAGEIDYLRGLMDE